MIIIQDTREQKPIVFPKDDLITEVKVSTLQVGDYRAQYSDGTLSSVVFERKSISDLWGTMLKGHDRFKREMALAKKIGVNLTLIIEAPITKILDGFSRSEFSGESMLKKLGTLFHKYGLRTVFCASRDDMANYMVWEFKSEGRARFGG